MGQLIENVLKVCGDDCMFLKFRDVFETDVLKINIGGFIGSNVGFSLINYVFIYDLRYFYFDLVISKGILVVGMEKVFVY